MIDYDLPSVFSEKYRTAYKDHKCCECFSVIPKGANYHFAKGCWEGKWQEFKTCIQCNDQRYEVRDASDGDMPPFGCLQDWCGNCDIIFWKEATHE